jgi:hypothetical protein
MARMARRGRPPHPDIPTPEEWGVLDRVRHGMSNAVIARERQTSVQAVKFHLENIRDKPHADRAALKHWTGIPRGSAVRRRKMANTMEQVKLGAIGQVAVTVKDIGRAEAFYRDVLGMTHMYTFGQLAFLRLRWNAALPRCTAGGPGQRDLGQLLPCAGFPRRPRRPAGQRRDFRRRTAT